MNSDFEGLHPRGDAGRFSEKGQEDPGAGVLGGGGPGPKGHAALLELCPEDLQRLVDGSPAEQVIAAKAMSLTDEQAAQLADPGNEFAVRLMVATRTHPGVAARAAQDPDPVVRLRALQLGFDLPDEVRDQLANDPDVKHAATVFGHASTHVAL